MEANTLASVEQDGKISRPNRVAKLRLLVRQRVGDVCAAPIEIIAATNADIARRFVSVYSRGNFAVREALSKRISEAAGVAHPVRTLNCSILASSSVHIFRASIFGLLRVERVHLMMLRSITLGKPFLVCFLLVSYIAKNSMIIILRNCRNGLILSKFHIMLSMEANMWVSIDEF